MAYTWTDEDVSAYLDFCSALGITDHTIPLRVWASESDNEPTAHDPNGNASGIFQLMPKTAKELGYDVENDPDLSAYRALTVAEQLVWATKYYASEKAFLGTVAGFYCVTFMPAVAHLAENNPSFVICAAEGPYAWAYEANKGFDRDGKGTITAQDLTDAAERQYGPRARSIAAMVAAAS